MCRSKFKVGDVVVIKHGCGTVYYGVGAVGVIQKVGLYSNTVYFPASTESWEACDHRLDKLPLIPQVGLGDIVRVHKTRVTHPYYEDYPDDTLYRNGDVGTVVNVQGLIALVRFSGQGDRTRGNGVWWEATESLEVVRKSGT